MQPTDNIQPNLNETVPELTTEWLRQVPSELVNIIPENVWVSLSVDQKKEILRQHNIFEKYAGNKEEAPKIATNVVVSSESKPGIVVEQQQRLEKDPEFEKAFSEFKEISEQKEEEKVAPVLSQEDINRINTENANKANSQSQSYSFFGYQPSQTIFTNAKQSSQTGDVSDAKTWASTLISKIFSLFQ